MTNKSTVVRLLGTGALLATLGLQPVLADEFPANAQTPSASELSALLVGKTWLMSPKRGGILHLQHAADGSFQLFVGGRSDTGTWRAEDGRVCYELKVFNSACNDVRMADGELWFKRSNGEVVKITPK